MAPLPSGQTTPVSGGDGKKRRRRPKQDYKHRTPAVHITLYNYQGESIPAEVREKAAKAILQIALDNNLLIGVATT